MFKKLGAEFFAQVLTIGATGYVLITLSGDTLDKAIWITGATIILHFLGVAFISSKED